MLITASPKDAEPGAPARTSADRCDGLLRSVERLTRWLDRVRVRSVRTRLALTRLAFRVARRSVADSSPDAAADGVRCDTRSAAARLGFGLGSGFGFGLGFGLGATVAVKPISPYRGAAGTTSTRAAGTRPEPWTPRAGAALAAGAVAAART